MHLLVAVLQVDAINMPLADVALADVLAKELHGPFGTQPPL